MSRNRENNTSGSVFFFSNSSIKRHELKTRCFKHRTLVVSCFAAFECFRVFQNTHSNRFLVIQSRVCLLWQDERRRRYLCVTTIELYSREWNNRNPWESAAAVYQYIYLFFFQIAIINDETISIVRYPARHKNTFQKPRGPC